MKYILAILFVLPHLVQGQDRPDLFFREDFKETEAQIPITQDHINNPDIVLSLYGPGSDVIKKSHHDKPADDPFYVWSGLCEGNWAVTLKHRSLNVDLSGQARIRWRSKQTGFRHLYLVLKLGDGSWIIADPDDGPSKDWRMREIILSDMVWLGLDIESVIETRPVMNPDLSDIEEIGWTDLMRGGGTPASSRVDWIEVDGFSKVR